MNPDSPFAAQRYRFVCEVERPLRLPDFAGSALRGAFGHALRKAACVTRERLCAPCLLYRTCPYPAIFDTPPPLEAGRVFSNIPNPFVVEPPPWGMRDHESGEELSFGLVLIGPALAQLPLVILAWERALLQGVGPGEGTARLLRVEAEGVDGPIYEASGGRVVPHVQILPLPPREPTNQVDLEFETPLRLQRNGHALGVQRLEPYDLLMGLVRRVGYLCEFQLRSTLDVDFHSLAHAAGAIEGDKSLQWKDWTRYSARQRKTMVLGGAVGRWRLAGDLGPFVPFLHLGQWLHVGKNASFGLGRYKLV